MARTPDIVAAMHEQQMLPAIFFIFSRAACDENAARLSAVDGVCLTSRQERELIGQEIARLRSLPAVSLRDAMCLAKQGSTWQSCCCKSKCGMKLSTSNRECNELLNASLCRVHQADHT